MPLLWVQGSALLIITLTGSKKKRKEKKTESLDCDSCKTELKLNWKVLRDQHMTLRNMHQLDLIIYSWVISNTGCVTASICNSQFSHPLKATNACSQGLLLALRSNQKVCYHITPGENWGSNAMVLHLVYAVTVMLQDLTSQPSGYELLLLFYSVTVSLTVYCESLQKKILISPTH